MTDVWWANLKCPVCGATIRDIEPSPDVSYRQWSSWTEYRLPTAPTCHPCGHLLPSNKKVVWVITKRAITDIRIEDHSNGLTKT